MSDAVIVAIVTLVGVVVTATLAFLANRKAGEINDAVNHRHENEPRIFDVVKQIRAHQVAQEQRMEIFDMKLDLIQEQSDSNGRAVARLERGESA